MLVTASQEAGVLEENEEQMLHRVFGFADLNAGQIMVPHAPSSSASTRMRRAEALLDLISRTGHSRLPVYRKNLDNVIGILYATDVVRRWPRAHGT